MTHEALRLADALEMQTRTMRLAGQNDAVTETMDQAVAPLRQEGLKMTDSAVVAALRKLRGVVIEQNRLGATWHQNVFGELMQALADADSALAQLEQPAGEWQLVPREPNKTMIEAAADRLEGEMSPEACKLVYEAMLAAAPQATAHPHDIIGLPSGE